MLCKEELIWHTEICKLAAAICVEKGTEKWDTLDIYISCGAVLQICFLRACRTWPPCGQSRVARLGETLGESLATRDCGQYRSSWGAFDVLRYYLPQRFRPRAEAPTLGH